MKRAPAPSSSLGVVAAFIVVAIAITSVSVWAVRVKSASLEAGYRVHALRTKLVELEHQRAALEVERAALLRPSRLAAIARNELGLVPPDVTTTIGATP